MPSGTASGWPTSVYDAPASSLAARLRRRPADVLLMPTWQIVDSRFWKAQVAYLCPALPGGHVRRPRLRPVRPAHGRAAYADHECAADAVAVLDATGTERAVLVALSCGATWSVHVAAASPRAGARVSRDRAGLRLGCQPARNANGTPGTRGWTASEGWAKYNRHYWLQRRLRRLPAVLLRADCSTSRTPPSRSRTVCAWSADDRRRRRCATPTAGRLGLRRCHLLVDRDGLRRVRCPVHVVHGTEDRISRHAVGERLAELTGGSLRADRGRRARPAWPATRCWSTR